MVGREAQWKLFQQAFKKNKSSFIALTGRRRVGKTYLIKEACKNNLCFHISGIQNGDTTSQLINFMNKLKEFNKDSIYYGSVDSWQEAFILLKQYLSGLPKNKKQVIFFDELPWMATAKSGFVQLLAHLWNDYLSTYNHFILVICGSATSWITQKILNDTGGFHNRVSMLIHLEPFTLAETKQFLESKKIKYSPSGIAEVYMSLGGLPFYLELIEPGESPQQAIGRLCFSKTGLLKNEYTNLYKALFAYWENHEALVAALSQYKSGLTREELIKKSKVKAGGPFTRAMEELVTSGFVQVLTPFGKINRGKIYRMADEFTVFYHRFIKGNEGKGIKKWAQIYDSQPYKIWKGHAFESLCLKHTEEIKNALGISGVYSEEMSFYSASGASKKGVQIDLIIDRKDAAINLCECKFYSSTFEISKKYGQELKDRKQIFSELTGSKKMLINTLISNELPIKNAHYYDSIDQYINLEQLF